MKHLVSIPLLVGYLLLASITADAQFGYKGKKTVEEIKGTTTLFVLQPNMPAFNAALEKYVPEYWDISEYKFIEQQELENYVDNEEYSFVTLIQLEISQESSLGRANDPTTRYLYQYDLFHLCLFMGGKKKFKKYGVYDMVGYANIMAKQYSDLQQEKKLKNNTGTSNPYQEIYELMVSSDAVDAEVIRAVQSINLYCNTVLKERLSNNNNKDLVKAYSKNKREIRQKTLLISEDDVKGDPEEQLVEWEKMHSGIIKIVPQEEIYRAIEAQESDICYAIIFYEHRNLKMKAVVQAKDSKVLYAEVSSIFNGLFNVSDKTIKKINK